MVPDHHPRTLYVSITKCSSLRRRVKGKVIIVTGKLPGLSNELNRSNV